MAHIFIGIGSNSDPTENIAGGLRDLMQHFGKLTLSQTYATQPFEGTGDEFYNLVVGCHSGNSVESVVKVLKAIESAHGRTHLLRNLASIVLDLDLLTFDNLRLRTSNISIPHADISNRAYILKPLAEIAPQTRHPEIGDTYEKMWSEFIGTSGILRNVTPLFADIYRLNESLAPLKASS